MSTLQSRQLRSSSVPIPSSFSSIDIPPLTASQDSREIQNWLISLANPSPTFVGRSQKEHASLPEALFDRRAELKILTSQIAMHLDDKWRNQLFAQLDYLLDLENWETEDIPPSASSFRTFLRLILLLKVQVRPGLGASADGQIIAAWTNGRDKLTIECLPADIVRWSIARDIDDIRERAVGETSLTRLRNALQPYEPQVWFGHADELRSS